MSLFQAVLRKTVSAITYTLIDMISGERTRVSISMRNQVVEKNLLQHRNISSPMRLPLALLTVLFGLSSIFAYGSVFYRLDTDRRRRFIKAWKYAPLGFARDLIRFHESLCILFTEDLRFQNGLYASDGDLSKMTSRVDMVRDGA